MPAIDVEVDQHELRIRAVRSHGWALVAAVVAAAAAGAATSLGSTGPRAAIVAGIVGGIGWAAALVCSRVDLVLGPHDLRIGPAVLAWSDVYLVHWATTGCWVQARDGHHDLSWLCLSEPQLHQIQAATDAVLGARRSERADQRAQRLPEPEVALRDLNRLGRAPS